MAGKGQPKTGGRKKGVGNAVAQEARKFILEKVQPLENIERLIHELDDPKDQIDAYTRLLPFAVAKLANTQVDLKAALVGDTELIVNLTKEGE